MNREREWDVSDDCGAIASEYGILLAFVVFVIVAGVGAFGQNLAVFIGRLATGIAGYLGV